MTFQWHCCIQAQKCHTVVCGLSQLHDWAQTFTGMFVSWIFAPVRLCRADARIPCSPVDYDWCHGNWVAVALLPMLNFTARLEPALSRSLGQGCDSWQERPEQPPPHIRRSQLGSFWNIYDPHCFLRKQEKSTQTFHILSNVFFLFLVLPQVKCDGCFQDKRCHALPLCWSPLLSLKQVPVSE